MARPFAVPVLVLAAVTAPAAIPPEDDVFERYGLPRPLPEAGDVDRWGVRFRALNDAPADGAQGAATRLALELAEEPASTSLAVLRAHLRVVASPELRRQVLLAVAVGRAAQDAALVHGSLPDLLDLGVRDPSPVVQAAAFERLRIIALADLALDFAAYEAWYAGAGGRSTSDVLVESVRRVAGEAASADDAQTERLAALLTGSGALWIQSPAARDAARAAGWHAALAGWLARGGAATESARRIVAVYRLDEQGLREVVLPCLARDRPLPLRAWAAATLGDARAAWAVDDLALALAGTLEDDAERARLVSPLTRALAATGDARAIPVLIGVLRADGSPATARTIGTFGLAPLTGVAHDPAHDGAWWTTWWSRNRGRFGEPARSLDIPEYRAAAPSGTTPR